MNSSAEQPKRLTCFVISPIGKPDSEVRKKADQVLKHLIRKALGENYDIKRGDEESNPGSITSQIIESILEADLVIADLSGFNPNVYYEVAVAHGYERPTVHIQRSDETPAFDLKDMRLVQYNLQDPDELEKAQRALAEFAQFAARTPDKAKTPLSDAKRFVEIAGSSDPVAQSNLEVMEQLRELRSEVRAATRTTSRTARAPHVDLPSLRKIVENAATRGGLITSDFDSVITVQTSQGFDDWARRTLAKVSGIEGTENLNEILFDAETMQGAYDAEDHISE